MFPPASSFRMQFKPVFLFVYIVGSIGGAAFVVLWRFLDPQLANVESFVLLETIGYYTVFVCPVYAALCAWLMARGFQYKVTPEGIGGAGFFGSKRFAKWEDISTVKPAQVGNLGFVRLVTTDGALPVWLPLFVRDDEGLGGTILEHAPEDSVARSLVRTVHVAA